MINKLIKSKVRVIIPFKEDDLDEFIEIRNPKEYVIKKVKERLINRIEGRDDFDNNEILEYLIKELTNIELNEPLNDLLKKDISFECKMMLFHISEIYNEIQQEMLSMMKLDIMNRKAIELEKEVALEMSQV